MLAQLLELHDMELVRVDPLADHAFRAINPLAKVPALVDGDVTLFESRLICEYLDDKSSANDGKSFFQRNTPGYYGIQKAHALADGVLDAALATVMELRREDAEHSGFWLERWHVAMLHAIKDMTLNDLGTSDRVHMGTIATVSALAYLDYRLPPLNWRECNRALREWYETMESQPWIRKTAPEEI